VEETMHDDSVDPALYPMIVWYSQTSYAIFDQVGYDQALEAAQAASDFNNVEPLLMRNKKGEFASREIPNFGERSGPFCVAMLAAFLVWSQHKGQGKEDGIYLPDSVFLKAAEEGYQMYRFFTGG
jgi:hypothetical protein